MTSSLLAPENTMKSGDTLLSGLHGVLQQVVSLNCVQDSFQKNKLARVAHPRVEDPPGLLGPELRFVVEAACQHLLAERHDVRGLREVKPLVTPHLPRGSSAGLDLVHQVDNVVLLAQSLQTLEPLVGSMMVSALGLYRLHYDPRHGASVTLP